MHLDFDLDLNLFQAKSMQLAKSSQSSVWLITKAARSLLATLAFGHLTEPIWLALLIVALPDLATPIAKSFGTIEIRRTIAGLKSPTGDLRGKRAGDKCRLSLVRGVGGGGRHFKLYNWNAS